METDFIYKDTKVGAYIPVPLCLLNSSLGSTELLIYGMLLNRALLSQKNGWGDSDGRIFERYTWDDLAELIGRGRTTIGTALKKLEHEELIIREYSGRDGYCIYVKIPSEFRKYNQAISEIRSQPVQKSGNGVFRKLHTNNYTEIHDQITDKYTFKEGESL
ncbi:Replication initiator protein A (RepA) N-terminus [Butyrivibrio sp. INlla18]|uniref:replication initiator protein A n=1 Tax=Butyrivibrio sp. INlla18 TaxID=1520806 RepID=UPI0008888D7A|nr:replication initiator protein A [Butyrivibrio sp. INlla18]SDA39087.1 Replication initiator protein A (RepA) N-terminus [Butyrivibrio sp. INlla18]